MNSEDYLKRVLVAAWYWDITAYNFHTPDSVQLDAAFHHRLFLKKQKQKKQQLQLLQSHAL